MKAAIFTIGTEVVDGEIVNTNASWLARQLDHYGLTVTHHVSTSDLESDMKEGLEWLVEKADWVFVSGGLGPTTDDRTRNVVADVVGDELRYAEDVWDALGESYRARGFTVTDDHKQQCFFPENCRRLENPVGSALGFVSTVRNTTIVVLPGPPSELKAVFARGVEPEIKNLHLRKARLVRWVCLGITESGAAEKVEAAIGGQGLEIGYRAVIPYVHVKVWVSEDRAEQPIIDRVNEAIGEYSVATGTDDPGRVFPDALSKISDYKLMFADRLSNGQLVDRLRDLDIFATRSVGFMNLSHTSTLDDSVALFVLEADEQGHVWASASVGGDTMREHLIDPPYTVDLNNPRAQRYFAEQALHHWARFLQKNS